MEGYAWKAEQLHERKTLPLKNSQGPPRKCFAARMILDEASDPKKHESYRKRLPSSYIIMIPRIRLVRKEREFQERVGKRSSPIESSFPKISSYITPAVINIVFLYYLESPHINAFYVLLSFLSIFSYLFYIWLIDFILACQIISIFDIADIIFKRVSIPYYIIIISPGGSNMALQASSSFYILPDFRKD